MSLKHVVHSLVHKHPEGITIAADEINERRVNKISKQALINKLNPDGDTDCLNIVDFDNLVFRLKFNIAIARYFTAPVNAIVVEMPTVPEGDMALLDDFMAIAKEMGDISHRFQQAFADGVITKPEFKTVAVEIDEAIQALIRFKESVKLRVEK